MPDQLSRDALAYHRLPVPGKLAISATKPLASQHDLSLAYSPGVAAACDAIAADPAEASNLTARSNLVAVVTNGTAVLGLGAIGPLAANAHRGRARGLAGGRGDCLSLAGPNAGNASMPELGEIPARFIGLRRNADTMPGGPESATMKAIMTTEPTPAMSVPASGRHAIVCSTIILSRAASQGSPRYGCASARQVPHVGARHDQPAANGSGALSQAYCRGIYHVARISCR